MPNPQQPELRRSERVPALDPDATEAVLTAQDQRAPAAPTDPGAPLPDEQRPGHHPEHDQDKPPLDAMAERLGVRPEGDEPAGAPSLTATGPDADADEPLIITSMRKRRRALALAIAVPAAGFVIVRRLLRR